MYFCVLILFFWRPGKDHGSKRRLGYSSHALASENQERNEKPGSAISGFQEDEACNSDDRETVLTWNEDGDAVITDRTPRLPFSDERLHSD